MQILAQPVLSQGVRKPTNSEATLEPTRFRHMTCFQHFRWEMEAGKDLEDSLAAGDSSSESV